MDYVRALTERNQSAILICVLNHANGELGRNGSHVQRLVETGNEQEPAVKKWWKNTVEFAWVILAKQVPAIYNHVLSLVKLVYGMNGQIVQNHVEVERRRELEKKKSKNQMEENVHTL